jgi:hypothetical protein
VSDYGRLSDPDLVEAVIEQWAARDATAYLLRALLRKVEQMSLDLSRLNKAFSDNSAAQTAHTNALIAKASTEASNAASVSAADQLAVDGVAAQVESVTASIVAATALVVAPAPVAAPAAAPEAAPVVEAAK